MLRPPLGARRLLGSIGWLLPPPQQGLVFRSYRATENSSGGLYVPDLAYGRAPPSDERSLASRRERAACLALPRLPCTPSPALQVSGVDCTFPHQSPAHLAHAVGSRWSGYSRRATSALPPSALPPSALPPSALPPSALPPLPCTSATSRPHLGRISATSPPGGLPLLGVVRGDRVGDDASVREAQLLTASLHGCSCEQVRLLFREAPLTHATGEDFHLSHMLRKYAGVRSYVLPAGDPSFGGDTDHRLAYSRYSTGGAPTIALREHSRDVPPRSPRDSLDIHPRVRRARLGRGTKLRAPAARDRRGRDRARCSRVSSGATGSGGARSGKAPPSGGARQRPSVSRSRREI